LFAIEVNCLVASICPLAGPNYCDCWFSLLFDVCADGSRGSGNISKSWTLSSECCRNREDRCLYEILFARDGSRL